MRIRTDYLRTIFKKVQQIKEHKRLYVLDPERTPVSLEDLKWVVEDMYSLTIEVWKVSY